ncbi:MAG: septal ring lytic transglycosylase RlpA family protein [Acidobacteriota bacterium]
MTALQISLLPLAGEGTAKRRMRVRGFALSIALFLAYSCATTAPPPQQIEVLHGVASWYGQEFAGRTTANGEIFDPLLLTAAHRTLPFGTVVDVKNAKTSKIVRVRINDRGPYVGNRLIDLSYAAAQQIGLVEPGSGEVDLAVVTIGKGEREPPAPYSIVVAEAVPPPVEMPVVAPAAAPAIVDQVQVIEVHRGVETRRQVAADGKTIEAVPVRPSSQQAAGSSQPAPVSREPLAASRKPPSGRFVIQVGAFGDEKNAVALQQKLRAEGFETFIDRGPVLHKVQIGPFETRELAVKTRARLEAAGVSAIIITSGPTR